MSKDRPGITKTMSPDARQRSRLANGKLVMDEAVDGRSVPARRYRDIRQAIVQELGGEARLNTALRGLVDRLAAVRMMLDQMISWYVGGHDNFSQTEFLSLCRLARNIEATLGLIPDEPETYTKGESLEDIMAEAGADPVETGDGRAHAPTPRAPRLTVLKREREAKRHPDDEA